MRLALLSGLAALCLVSCGGGGSGGGNSGGGGGPVTPAPTPEIRVSLSQTEGSTKVSEASTESSFTFTASATTTGALPANVHANLQYDADLIQEAVIEAGSVSGTYVVRGKSRADLGGGQHVATIVFRLCQDADCKTIYPGSTQNYTYKITSTVAAWNTWQGNSKRNGYVNITIDPSQIRKAWSHEGDSIFGDVVSDKENLYYQKTYWKSEGVVDSALVALRLNDGGQIWTRSLGEQIHPSGLSMIGNYLHMTQDGSSHLDPPASWIVNKIDGTIIRRLIHTGPDHAFVRSVPTENAFVTMSGYRTTLVTAYAASNGSQLWQKTLDIDWGRHALAADDANVAIYARDKTTVLDVTSGEISANILHRPNPLDPEDYYGTPVIGDNNIVYIRGERNSNINFGHPIRALNRINQTIVWSTESGYESDFAYAKGIIYAIHSNPRRLDAVDAKDGRILWSWVSDLPEPVWGIRMPDEYHKMITGNVLVTNNLVFINLPGHIRAIDLKTREIVWRYDRSGNLSITPDGHLILVEGGLDTIMNRLRAVGPITAFKLY